MTIQPTNALLQAIRMYKNGDQKAFEQIYRLSLPYLTTCTANVIYRAAPNASRELMEDVLQNTYMTIAEKLHTLQNDASYFQWAGQIATNHALRVWKQDSRRHELEQPEDDLVYELPDERFIPEDILESREKQQLIRRMLQELPNGQYMCLVEYFYNGLKETEIAEKLEMPLGTVKTNLSRAKKKLKEIVLTHEKTHSVKLYSMSWLLLWLLCEDLTVSAATLGAAAPAVQLVAEESAAIGQAAAGASAAAGSSSAAGVAGSSSAVGAAASSSAAGAAITGGSAVAAGLVVKIAAGVLAAAVTVFSAVTLLSPKKQEEVPRESVQPTEEYWAGLPILTPQQIASIEDVLGALEPGSSSEGTFIPDQPTSKYEDIEDGILCNAEYLSDEILIFSGETAQGFRIEATVERHADGWRVQTVQETARAKTLYPINAAMREKGIPAVPCGWTLTDEYGLSYDGAYCCAVVFWRETLGHLNFSVISQGEQYGWYYHYLAHPDYLQQENYEIWDGLIINWDTLEIAKEVPPDLSSETSAEQPEDSEPAEELPDSEENETPLPEELPAVTNPWETEPEIIEPENPEQDAVPEDHGDIVLTAEILDYINRVVNGVSLMPPPTGPAISYRQGSTQGLALDVYIAGCAGENGLLRGKKTADGLVIRESDLDAFLRNTLGWTPSMEGWDYYDIKPCGDGSRLICHYGGDSPQIMIHNICAESSSRLRVSVLNEYATYDCFFDRSPDSVYGWILTEAVDTQKQLYSFEIVAPALMSHGIVVPGNGAPALAMQSSNELSQESAAAYLRHYLWKTTGKLPYEVVAEEWGLVANSYYTYMLHVLDQSGKEQACYLIGTSDSAIAEYLGPDVPRTWFTWELTE